MLLYFALKQIKILRAHGIQKSVISNIGSNQIKGNAILNCVLVILENWIVCGYISFKCTLSSNKKKNSNYENQ